MGNPFWGDPAGELAESLGQGRVTWLFAKSEGPIQNDPKITEAHHTVVTVLLPRQQPLICTRVEPIHLVHGPPGRYHEGNPPSEFRTSAIFAGFLLK